MKKLIITALATMIAFYGYSQDGIHLPLTGGNVTGDVFILGAGAGRISLFGAYSGSPASPGFEIKNSAGELTFQHNSNGGSTNIAGNLTGRSSTFKGLNAYDGIVNIDNSSTTGGGILSIKQNGVTSGFLSVVGSAIGNSDRSLALYAETGLGFNLYTNGSPSPVWQVAQNGNTTFSGVLIGRSGNFDLNTQNLTNNILTIKGGGVSGAYGLSVQAHNGDNVLSTDHLTYRTTLGGPLQAMSANFSGPLYANQAGSNIRLKADGTNDKDGGLFCGVDGTIYLRNWDSNRGLSITPNGVTSLLGGLTGTSASFTENVAIGTSQANSNL